MTGVHLERLYVSSWERSLRLDLREKKLGYEEQKQRWARSAVKYVTKKWKGAHQQLRSHTAVMIGTPSSFQLRMNSRSSSIFTCWMSLLKFSSVVPVQWKFKQLYYYYCKWWICWKEYAAYLQGWKCRAAQLWSCLGCCRGGAAQAARSSWDPSPLDRPHLSPLPGPARRHSFRWFKGKLG